MKGSGMHVWSVIAVAAVAVFLVGLLLLSGGAQAVACIASAVVFLVACVRALDTESYRKRERDLPSPPGSGP
jgi:membrane protein implicated in regulation of membrane protease activity